jgi:hypothetical protein
LWVGGGAEVASGVRGGHERGLGMNWRNDPSAHNCSISCAMGLGLRYGQLGSFEHFDSQCLEYERGWGAESSAAVG